MIKYKLLTLILIRLAFTLKGDANHSCNNHGIYNEEIGQCECSDGFITFPYDSNVKCNYQLRDYSIAKFLSLFGGYLGADQFYLGNTFKGIIKCTMPIILFVLLLHYYDRIKQYYYSRYVITFPFIISILFYLFDLCMICMGLIKDAHGHPLNYQ